MNRKAFQKLAAVRLAEAKCLLANGYPHGAYYLAGYAVECALKACIARATRRHDFPPDRKTVEQCYSHDLGGLLRAARLETQLSADFMLDASLALNWSTVRKWSEQARYRSPTKTEAYDLISALTDPTHGVLPWLIRHW